MTEQNIKWPAIDDEVLRTLPPVLRATVKALGFGRASIFLDMHGGLNCNLPKFKSAALGLETDELARLRVSLKAHMDSNDRVWLPKVDKLFIIVRNEQIIKAKDRVSISAQVREYKLSNRHIMNIRRALTKDERMSESQLKRNLTFSSEELTALKNLAEEKLNANISNTIYIKILNKLNRAVMQVSPKAKFAQFDLF